MHRKLIYFAAVLIILVPALIIYSNQSDQNKLPVIAIANYGPHSSLEATIYGFKAQMHDSGFVEDQNIHYEIADVGFDPALIPQMILSLKAKNPKMMLVMATPIAQAAKHKIHNIPLIYTAITDPVEAGLLKEKHQANDNISGSSDMQDLTAFLKFVISLLPTAKKVGVLYSTSEANDTALVNMMRKSASSLDMSVIAVPVEQVRDVQTRVQALKDKVDFIYVGTSGAIQPALPTIAAEARKMHIPVFNVEDQAVKDGIALASFGINYTTVGKNAGKLAVKVLQGQKINDLAPLYPSAEEHHAVINKKLAVEYSITIPPYVEVVG